ncbi:MAG: putative DegT/DnrJ/EryC1/StrS aminotransferase protein family [Fibrobacteres bacterium]|nr:putative DegT/DnrJ/EryC1/StrS aminotransferase protein family [Fibrobacterota bacterium]
MKAVKPAKGTAAKAPAAQVPAAQVPFQDLYPANRLVEKEFLAQAAELYRESAFSGGPYVHSFEKAFAGYLGARHCLGLNSGTSAVHLALAALDIGPGDEVIVPAFTFVGSAWGILYCGATPVFADVDPDTACIDANSLAGAITPRTKAVIVVHLFGRPADMDLIQAVLDAHHGKRGQRIALIEDAAQAHGALWDGKAVGTLGDAGCFSFYPSKNLGAAGEAGAVITKSAAMAEKIERLRNHGQKVRYRHDLLGFNYRMDGLQGLFLEKKLAFLDRMNAERSLLATAYLEGLYSAEAVPLGGGEGSVWHLFVCRVKRRKAFLAHLDKHGIGYGIHYPVTLPELPPFRDAEAGTSKPGTASASRKGKGSKPGAGSKARSGSAQPHALELSRSVVSLPLFYGMKMEQVERVVDVVNAFG